MSTPDLSVIIPVYNRGDIIRYTLESVRRASVGLNVETIIVDDGSSPPTADTLARLGFTPSLLVRQDNQGLLYARLAGLNKTTGRNVLFLDSDDLVSPEKFHLQLAAMAATGADVSYSDSACCTIEGDYDSLQPMADSPAPDTTDCTEFCIVVQPAPHSPIFRAEWLRHAVDHAFFPPSPLYNSVAEIWFYHNAAPRRGRAVRVPGPHTIIGRHPGARLTDHWEKLGVASLGVMEAFAKTCPDDTPEAARARQFVAEKAFLSWRRLPRGFSAEFCAREMAIWRRLAKTRRLDRLGGTLFQCLARLLGPANAGRVLRLFQSQPYANCRTLDNASLDRLLASLPSP